MKLFKRNDILIISAVLLLALLFAIPKLSTSDSLTASIYVGGELERTIDLSSVTQEYTLSPVEGIEITVNKGEIYFSHAECKDKLCVKSGKLDGAGQTAACLPSRVVISVSSGKNKNDVITY